MRSMNMDLQPYIDDNDRAVVMDPVFEKKRKRIQSAHNQRRKKVVSHTTSNHDINYYYDENEVLTQGIYGNQGFNQNDDSQDQGRPGSQLTSHYLHPNGSGGYQDPAKPQLKHRKLKTLK